MFSVIRSQLYYTWPH